MLTQRLGSATQRDPVFIDSLIAQIKAHPGSCDEVWFATDYGFPPLEKHRVDAEALAPLAEKFRAAGVRVSLQLSNSIGHGQYMCVRDCRGLVSPESKVRHMVGHDGVEAGYCFCWNDSVFREYTFTALRFYLKAVKPYRLWVDDDLRATNHDPVHFGCFCDDCVRRFNERFGTDFDRRGLVAAINDDIEIRKNHVTFLRDSLNDFVLAMGKAVSEELPGCRMGWQGCANGGYTGCGYEFIYDAMKETTGEAPGSRPGGGAYSDYSPQEFVSKAAFIAYQNHMLPDYVTDKRPEIESLPDVVFGKSIAGTCFETSCYLANGNTAMSYAILMNDYEPMNWHGEMLGAFAAHRPYWEILSDISKRATMSGLTPFYPKTAWLAPSKKPFDYSHEEIFVGHDLRFCAVPIAVTKKEASVYLINGRIAGTLSPEEADYLLENNVVCDGEAVAVLAARGILKGVNAETVNVQRLRERFTGHEINKGFAGRTWGGQIWRKEDYLLTGDGLEPVCEYYSASSGSVEVCGISAAVFTTEKGGRWAAFGFDLWSRTKSTEKRTQLLNACEYISGSRFIAELITPLQANVIPYIDEDGKCIAVNIINCTVGKSGALEVRIDCPAGTDFSFVSQYSAEIPLKAEKLGENSFKVTIPDLEGWSVGTVLCR